MTTDMTITRHGYSWTVRKTAKMEIYEPHDIAHKGVSICVRTADLVEGMAPRAALLTRGHTHVLSLDQAFRQAAHIFDWQASQRMFEKRAQRPGPQLKLVPKRT